MVIFMNLILAGIGFLALALSMHNPKLAICQGVVAGVLMGLGFSQWTAKKSDSR